MDLQVFEIFYSIEGETTAGGFPAVFIRLAGCNLNCRYCDTIYARGPGTTMAIDAIMESIRGHPSLHHVTVTGGEPLLQKGTIPLLEKITREGFSSQIETNGSITIRDVPAAVRKIVDVKTPSSGEAGSFIRENLQYITESDEIKFVIADARDYIFSRGFIKEFLGDARAVINFSPAHDAIPAEELARMILSDNLKVRLNLQLHKIIWRNANEGLRDI